MWPLQPKLDRRPVWLDMTPRTQVRRDRPALEHRPRQRRIRQRARLRPAQPRLRRPRDHVSDRRAGDPQTPGDRPVAGAACRLTSTSLMWCIRIGFPRTSPLLMRGTTHARSPLAVTPRGRPNSNRDRWPD